MKAKVPAAPTARLDAAPGAMLERSVTLGRGASLDEATILALQAAGIRQWVAEFEKRNGRLTAAERARARARIARAATE